MASLHGLSLLLQLVGSLGGCPGSRRLAGRLCRLPPGARGALGRRADGCLSFRARLVLLSRLTGLAPILPGALCGCRLLVALAGRLSPLAVCLPALGALGGRLACRLLLLLGRLGLGLLLRPLVAAGAVATTTATTTTGIAAATAAAADNLLVAGGWRAAGGLFVEDVAVVDTRRNQRLVSQLLLGRTASGPRGRRWRARIQKPPARRAHHGGRKGLAGVALNLTLNSQQVRGC